MISCPLYTPSAGSVGQTDDTMTNVDGKIGSRGLIWIVVVALVTTGEESDVALELRAT